ncbi:ExeM/NucH family extracellular endonuclease [Haliscomenobacter sp.]|uniref:ExeM/NucH family extracellular endonuclease n=1 Tax=Haliscomenobacter sp. TaxID=2717303 RepID=UPI003364FDE4
MNRLAKIIVQNLGLFLIFFNFIQIHSSAQPSELFISEYIEGSTTNKALEIFNGTGSTLNLNAYVLQVYLNGSTSPTSSLALFGSLPTGKVFVIGRTDADRAIINVMDIGSNGLMNFDGNDAIVLRKGGATGQIVDIIGQIGVDPGIGWSNKDVSTNDRTLRRRKDICKGDTDGSNAFDPAAEWEVFAVNAFDGLGKHAVICGQTDLEPQILSVLPSKAASGIAINANIVIEFSEPVILNGDWIQIIGSSSGSYTLSNARISISNAGNTYTLDPKTSFIAGEVITVQILAKQVQDQDANDPPDNLSTDYSTFFTVISTTICNTPATRISAIQGLGASSLLIGQIVDVEAIATGDFKDAEIGSLLGYFLQEEEVDYDEDERSSEGLFVFANTFGSKVAVGDRVRIRAQVDEFFGATILSKIRDVKVCTTKLDLPPPVAITLPLDSATTLETLENMRVIFPQKLTIVNNHGLGETGDLVLSSTGIQYQYTEFNAPNTAEFTAYQTQKYAERILLDDKFNGLYHTPVYHLQANAGNMLRMGNSVTDLNGIIDYSNNGFRIRPVAPVVFTNENPRPAPPKLAGELKVATFNVLNFFNGDGAGGGFPTSRGALNLPAFRLQLRKIVKAISKLDADVLGLEEIENEIFSPLSGMQELVDSLNVANGAGTYAFVSTGTKFGADQIIVAIIYKKAKVSPVGNPVFLKSNSGIFLQNRLPLAQTFVDQRGEKFTLVVNHLRSKLGDGTGLNADILDGQAAFNQVRVDGLQEILTWALGDPTNSNDPDIVMLGDFNAYEQEDPIRLMETAGFVNLVPAGQSKDFNGFLGDLDHIFASPSMVKQFLGGAKWNINSVESLSRFEYPAADLLPGTADDPIGDEFRCSDHDPVIAGFTLGFTRSMINGVVAARAGLPLSNVRLVLSGTTTAQNLTQDDGHFTFTNLDAGNYTLTPESLDENAVEGISTRDLIALQRHILGIAPLQNPYQLLAADVNNSGSITALDLVLMRRLILGLDKNFKAVPSWRFVDGSYVFKNPQSPWKEAYPSQKKLAALNGAAKLRFVGIKMGDVE